MSVAELTAAADRAAALPRPASRVRQRSLVASVAWGRFLHDPAVLDADDAGARADFLKLAAAAGASLSGSQQRSLSQEVARRYGPGGSRSQLSAASAGELLGSLEALAAVEDDPELVAARAVALATGGQHLSGLSGAELLGLARLASIGNSPAAGAAVVRLADQAWEKAAADQSLIDPASPMQELLRLAAARGGSDDWRRARAGQLCGRLLAGPGLPGLSDVGLLTFVRTIGALEPRSRQVVPLVALWVNRNPAWRTSSADVFGALVAGHAADGQATPDVAADLNGAVGDWSRLSAAARHNVRTMTAAWGPMLAPHQRQALAQRLRARAIDDQSVVGSLSLSTVCDLSDTLLALDESKGDPSTAVMAWLSLPGPTGASDWAAPDAPLALRFFPAGETAAWRVAEMPAEQLSSTLRAARKQLIAPGQVLRPDAARLLGIAARLTDSGEAWARLIDLKVRATTGDEQVAWLLADAVSDEAQSLPPDPLAGQAWVRKALGAARSPQTRFEVAAFALERYAAAQDFSAADALIARVRGSAQTDGERRIVSVWRSQITAIQQGTDQANASAAKALERSRLQGELTYLQGQADHAKQMGRSAADQAALSSAMSAAKARLDALDADGS